jgi:glutamine cyclotransferase
MRFCFLVLALLSTFACSDSGGNTKTNVNAVNTSSANKATQGPLPVYGYEIVKRYPHDPSAFTEGLFYHDGFLYESTGQKSSLRKVDLETGKVVQKFDLPREDFGEGIAMLGDKIYMLTWQQQLGRVFDAKEFKIIKEFDYQGEGWGMTTDGKNLIFDQGTHVIKVMDPETFKTVRTMPVMREDGRPLMQLNELEMIKGELWANIWHSEQKDILGKPNYIARIDPNSGKLLGWINLAGISPEDQPKGDDPEDFKAENTLNGIAYDAEKDRIFVTGKNWKSLYEINVTLPKAQ